MTTLRTDKILEVYGYIYGLYCRVSKKWYIGLTTWEPYWYIRKEYVLRKGGNRIKIARAIEKYGWEAFDVALLDSAMNADELNLLEMSYIKDYDSMNNGYNCTTGGTRFIKFSEEVLEKISKSMKEYWANLSPEEYEAYCESRSGENHWNFGGTMPDYIQEAILRSNIGRTGWNKGLTGDLYPYIPWNKGMKMTQEYCEKYILRGENHPHWGKPGLFTGRKHTEETKEKYSLERLGNKWAAVKVEIDGIIYESKTAAAKEFNMDRKTIRKLPGFRVIPKDK